MKRACLIYGLLTVLAVAIGLLTAVEVQWTELVERDGSQKMIQASRLAREWFLRVDEMKQAKGIAGEGDKHAVYQAMIGDDYTPMTTTLGSLEAKEIAANPDFAAVLVRLLTEAGIDSTGTVGVTLSGSFPSLAVCALAAMQTIGTDAVILSSLGSSTFGANQEYATWLDMEHWLAVYGGCRYTSRLVTLGAENDNGGGLIEEGIDWMQAACERNGVSLYVPETLEESINTKMAILDDADVDLLINIGGNQASLGPGPQALLIPNGLQTTYWPVVDSGLGIVNRLAQRQIPFIHLLGVKDLASQYGIPFGTPASSAPAVDVYMIRRVSIPAVVTSIGIILLMLVILHRVLHELTVHPSEPISEIPFFKKYCTIKGNNIMNYLPTKKHGFHDGRSNV
ncbi:MAG: poly-gamma-glutamate system protein [candidate division Zixibacteria bacterium]|nr:poly-gamma-glutamate system protein [candidate division Zixibacteria bacterium]